MGTIAKIRAKTAPSKAREARIINRVQKEGEYCLPPFDLEFGSAGGS